MNVRRKLLAVTLGAGLAFTGFRLGAGGRSTANPCRPAQVMPTTSTAHYDAGTAPLPHSGVAAYVGLR